jgi:CBS domain-containing protein
MTLAPDPLPGASSLRTAAARLAAEDAVPVSGEHGLRVADAVDVERALEAGESVTVEDVARPAEALPATASLAEAAEALAASEHAALPVVDSAGDVVGRLGHRDVLAVLARRPGRLRR